MLNIHHLNDDHLSALVVARPGLMRNSLVAYLRGVAAVSIVTLADDTLSALFASRQHPPHVILMDADISEEETLWLMRQLRCERPGLNFIVLVDQVSQQQLFATAGADQVLLKGFLDERLRRAIVRQEKGNEQRVNEIGAAKLVVPC